MYAITLEPTFVASHCKHKICGGTRTKGTINRKKKNTNHYLQIETKLEITKLLNFKLIVITALSMVAMASCNKAENNEINNN